MNQYIDFVLAYSPQNEAIITLLKESKLLNTLLLVVSNDHVQEAEKFVSNNCKVIQSNSLTSAKFLRQVSQKLTAPYTLFYLSNHKLTLSYRALDRFLQIASCLNTDREPLMVYADHNDGNGAHPVIDYQEGALRDDFDFGSLVLYSTEGIKDFFKQSKTIRYQYATLYALRLFISAKGRIEHIRESLYTEAETDLRLSGEKQFDYVNPSNREVQIEMERACTEHLKASMLGLPLMNTLNILKTKVLTQLKQALLFPFATAFVRLKMLFIAR